MKQNLFLTSVLVVAGLARPATAETFPTDGYMQEDKTYENAATYTNTGVYEGSVTATAEYTDNVYNIAAGMYLPAGVETAATCTAGNFCPGKTNATYDESVAQGMESCPTEYPNSAAGAGAQTQCYTACTLATANIAHATAVSGNDYYGDGADTCVATECELGYHVNESISLVAKTPVIPVDYTLPGEGYASVDASGYVGDLYLPDADLSEPNTWAAGFDYGTVYGRASCQPNLNSPAFDYVENNMELPMTGEMTYEEFESGLAALAGASKAKYITDILREIGTGEDMDYETLYETLMALYIDMSVMLASESDSNYNTTDSGEYCYCQTTGFTPTDGSFLEVSSASWVYKAAYESAAICASSCSSTCASNVVHDLPGGRGLRAALFGSLGLESGGTCDANDITINWTDAEEIGDAGMCKYDGDIKTPVKAVAKKGKTFKGWRFEKAN